MRVASILSLCHILAVAVCDQSSHAQNFAVIVDTSRFWHNYRHSANSVGIYHMMRRLGVPDSSIVLMLADDAACNSRNPFPTRVYSRNPITTNLYDTDIEVDYRGSQVTVANFLRVLTGRHEPHVPNSQRLTSDNKSNIFVYLTGHGGDEFLKFQDHEALSAQDIADAFEQMHQQKRYQKILFVIDTCQAATMLSRIYSPNIIGLASSLKDQSSYAYSTNDQIGVPLADRFTHFLLEWVDQLPATSDASMAELVRFLNSKPLNSNLAYRIDLCGQSLSEIRLMDYFAHSKVPTAVVPDLGFSNIHNNETHVPPNRPETTIESNLFENEREGIDMTQSVFFETKSNDIRANALNTDLIGQGMFATFVFTFVWIIGSRWL